MSQFDYIERVYGKTFWRGQKVVALGKAGVVTHATHYVYVRPDGQKHASPYHPDDVRAADATADELVRPQNEPL